MTPGAITPGAPAGRAPEPRAATVTLQDVQAPVKNRSLNYYLEKDS